MTKTAPNPPASPAGTQSMPLRVVGRAFLACGGGCLLAGLFARQYVFLPMGTTFVSLGVALLASGATCVERGRPTTVFRPRIR